MTNPKPKPPRFYRADGRRSRAKGRVRIVMQFERTPAGQAFYDAIHLAARLRRRSAGRLMAEVIHSALAQWGELPELCKDALKRDEDEEGET